VSPDNERLIAYAASNIVLLAMWLWFLLARVLTAPDL
jgi:hypothetical protein